MRYLEELFGLEGQVAVILGGTGTLPGAMAEGLARAGASVIIAGRNTEAGQRCVDRLRCHTTKASFIDANVCSQSDLEHVRETAVTTYGRIDILINGVGGNHPDATMSETHPFSAISRDAWQAVFDTNLFGGLVFPCQVIGEQMQKQRRGSIINIASVSAHLPLSRVPAYSAAKAAVVNLTKFLAREWASWNIRVNVISPGFFPATQNMALLFKDGQEGGALTERGHTILEHTPMRRVGKPEELIGAVLFLASDRASGFVTGADVRVDGGFTAMTI